MKYLITILILLAFAITSFSQHNDIHLPININSGIDSCIISKRNEDLNQIYSKHTFSNSGLITSSLIYDELGSIQKIEIFKYDMDDNLIEEFKHDIPNEKSMLFDTTTSFGKQWLNERRWHNRKTKIYYKYDSKNNLIKESVFSASYDTKKLTDKHNTFIGYYFYNHTGCLIKKIKTWPLRKNEKNIETDTIYFECDSNNNHSLEIDISYGKPKRVNKYSYNSYGEITKSEYNYKENEKCTQYLYNYDTLLNLISLKKIDSEDIVFAEYTMQYQDTIISKYYSTNRNNYETEINYKYDSTNRMSMSHSKKLKGSGYFTNPYSGSFYKYKNKYDSKNRIIEKKRFWKGFPFKNYEGKDEFFYDEENRIIRDKEYNENDSLEYINLYFYNKIDTLYKKIELDSDSSLISSEIYFHDSLGVKIARERYDNKGFVTLYQTYEYNEVGLEIGGVFYHDGYTEEIKYYNYNEDGTYNSIRIVRKKGNKVIDDYKLGFEYYKKL